MQISRALQEQGSANAQYGRIKSCEPHGYIQHLNLKLQQPIDNISPPQLACGIFIEIIMICFLYFV